MLSPRPAITAVALLIIAPFPPPKETPRKGIYKVLKGWIHPDFPSWPGCCEAFNPQAKLVTATADTLAFLS